MTRSICFNIGKVTHRVTYISSARWEGRGSGR